MIYIAAPLFSEMERDYIDKIVDIISKKLNLNQQNDFFIPHRNNEYTWESKIYQTNIENLNQCDMMIAILDGKDVDSGTAFEIGYFTSQDKPIFGLLTDKRSYNEDGNLNLKLNIMILESLNLHISDNINDLIDDLYEVLIDKYYYI